MVCAGLLIRSLKLEVITDYSMPWSSVRNLPYSGSYDLSVSSHSVNEPCDRFGI